MVIEIVAVLSVEAALLEVVPPGNLLWYEDKVEGGYLVLSYSLAGLTPKKYPGGKGAGCLCFGRRACGRGRRFTGGKKKGGSFNSWRTKLAVSIPPPHSER